MSAIDTQRRLEAAYGHRDADELRALIHADCVMVSVTASDGAPIRGREAIVTELVTRAVGDWVFQVTLERYRELDDDTLLITGAVRRRAGQGGHTMSSVAWINEFVDGVLIASRTFSCEAVALDAYGGRMRPRGTAAAGRRSRVATDGAQPVGSGLVLHTRGR